MPLVVTVAPTSGDSAPGPWISAMVFSTAGSGGGVTVVQAVPQATGLGAPAVKSAALLAVLSWAALRETELVLLGAGVGPVPAKSLAVVPKPTKSTTAALPSQSAPQVSAPVRVDECDLAGRAAHRDGAGDVGGDVGGAAGALGLAHDVVAAGRQRAGQRRGRPRGAGGGGVLDRPAGQVHRRAALVVELDEVLLVGRAGVAAAAVHLVDHNRGTGADSGPGRTGTASQVPATRAEVVSPLIKALPRARMHYLRVRTGKRRAPVGPHRRLRIRG